MASPGGSSNDEHDEGLQLEPDSVAAKIAEHQAALAALDKEVPSSDNKSSSSSSSGGGSSSSGAGSSGGGGGGGGGGMDYRVRLGCFAIDCTPVKQKVRMMHLAVLKGLTDRLRAAILAASTAQVKQYKHLLDEVSLVSSRLVS